MKYTATLNGKQYEVELERIDAYEPMPRYGEAPAAAPAEEENLTDDTELVSVITAAIAAYEGKETVDNGLVVRSIKRVSNRNWN